MATKDITDLQVLLAQKRWLGCPGSPFAYDILAAETGECVKVCYRAMERAFRRGLLDYGTSLRTAWITRKGEKMMIQARTRPFPGVEIEDGGPVIRVWVERRVQADMLQNTAPTPNATAKLLADHLLALKNAAIEKYGKADLLLWVAPDGSLTD